MHVHGNYNLQLAALGAGRNEMLELQARRAAEVRKKLSSLSLSISDEGEEAVAGVTSREDERRRNSDRQAQDDAEPRQRFSVIA